MIFLYPKVSPDSFVRVYGQDLLFTSRNLDLVVFAKYLEKGFVLKVPAGEPGKIEVGDHGDVIKHRNVVDQSQPFHMDASQVFLFFTDLVSEGLFTVDDMGPDNDACGQVILSNGRSGAR